MSNTILEKAARAEVTNGKYKGLIGYADCGILGYYKFGNIMFYPDQENFLLEKNKGLKEIFRVCLPPDEYVLLDTNFRKVVL